MRLMRLLHKWLSLVVGLQILLWTASGVAFAWLEHDAVTGHGALREPAQAALGGAAAVIEPAELFSRRPGAPPGDVALLPLGDQWIYRLQTGGRVELLRASDGAPFPITGPVVRMLANQRYGGTGSLREVALREAPVMEARGAGAVWEAAYDDPASTSLYFSAVDGRFVAARTDAWRAFDFFWMLHTMDFRGRDDFNNPVVILFTTGAAWVGLTGVLLLLQVFGVTRRLGSGLESRRRTRER